MTTDPRDARIAALEAEIEALRMAIRYSELWVERRDSAKREVAAVLGLAPSVSIHDIITAIKAVVAERDELRRRP